MSKTIDQRIVEMSFENHKFEKGINQSKNSLKEFSNALNNMGNGKDFRGLENSVQSVSSSFSMLEQIGIGALRRIGESAVNAGASLVKSLTIDQLSAGIDKYQEKIEAVQTMVSAGYDLEEVEKSMEQLMWFSDETSYSFADMANNMGKFISAGVELKTSEKAMQGIATWAAHSGKNSQAASIAMFNLSQAISLGYVDTMNWRSIMNQNMNTKMFKEIAIGVAETTGAIKEGQVTIQNFDSNLKSKWFTNDVLLKTLEQYSSYAEKVKEVQDEMGFDTAKQAMDYMGLAENAEKYADVLDTIGNAAFKASQESKSFMDSINATMDAVSTGWMRTYEIIFGTLYEAKENFSALTEVLWTVFASSAETRNEMLQLIKDGGGIKGLFKTIKNVAVTLLTPLKAISQAFDQFFPPKTSEQWLGLISILESITSRLIMSEETAHKIQRTFAGFFAILDLGWETVKLLGSGLYELVNIFIPLNGNLLEMTASIGDFLVGLNHLIKQSGAFQYGLLGVKIAAILIKDALTNIVGKVGEFVHALWTTDKPLELIGKTVQNLFSGVLNTMKTIITWVSGKFRNALSSIFTFLSKGLNLKDGGALSELLKTLKEFIEFIITEATGGLLDFGGALDKLDFNRIATFVSGGVLLLFVNQLTNLTKSMNGLVVTTNSFVTKFSKKLFGTTTKIKDLAFVFGVLSASLYVLSEIPWEKMKVGLAGLSGALLLFVGAYGAVQAITVAGSKALNGVEVIKSAISLKALAAGMIGMTIALKQISKISEYDVWRSVGVLGALMGVVVAYQALSAVISLIPKQTKLLTDFGGVALGLATLVGVIAVLQLLTPEIISSGLTKLKGIMEVLIVLQIAFAVAALIGGGNKLSTTLFGISAGILALVGVIKILSELNISEMSKGIENVFLIGGILSAIQLMFSLAARVSGGNKFKASIFSMTVGLAAMVALLAIMDSVGQKKLQNGIGTLTKMAGIIAGLEILTAVAARIGGGHKLQKILGSVTLTMLSFTALIGIINFMTPETIDKGLTTIKKMLAIILAFQGLVALTAVASKGATGGGLAAITGMVAGVLTVTAALILLSMQDQTALANAAKSLAMTVAAVGIMSTGIGLMIKSLSGLSTGLSGFRSIISKLLPGLAAMGVVLLATFALIELIKASNIADVSWNDLGKFIVGMGALTALATAFTMLAKVPGLASGRAGLATLVPGLGGMALVVIATAGLFKAISFVLDDIKNIKWSDFAMFTVGLALVGAMAFGIGTLSTPLAALGPLISPVLGGVLTAIGGVALIVLGFAGLAAAMEALFRNDPEFLTRGIDKLVEVAEGIGRFFGALASGFNKELMVGYGEGLAGFAEAIGTIDAASFDGVESLARALLILTATSILDGLSKLVNSGKNPGEVFGEQMAGLVKAFSKITPDDATKTKAIIFALTPMAEGLTTLAEAAAKIPESGGLAGGFAGNNDIDDFGKQIGKFIKGLAKIDLADAMHTSDIMLALAPMMDSFKGFIDAAEGIPEEGGWVAAFVGDNSIDDFGKSIGKFIKSITKVDIADATHTSNLLIALSPMVDSLKAFIDAASLIPEEGGWVSAFTGDNSIDDFAKGLAKMVKAFEKLDMGDIQSASDNINLMADDMLPSLHKFVSLTSRLSDIGGPWDQSLPLLNLAATLKEFVKTLSGVDVSIIGPALKGLEDINESFKVIGAEVLESAKASFDNNTQPFQTSIVTFLEGIIKEVDGRKGGITRSFSTIFTEALMVSKSYITQFKTLGSDIIKGLKEGIDKESPSATSAIGKVVKAVTLKTTRGFQVDSPSKVFEGIGKWIPAGLAYGIERNADVAIVAGVTMAEDFEDAFRDAIDIHSLGPKWVNAGGWVPKSIVEGIEREKGKLLDTAKNLGLDTSNLSIKGMAAGLTKGEGEVTKVVNDLIDLLTGQPSITESSEASGVRTGNAFGAGVAQGIGSSGSKKGVAKSAAELADDAFAAFKKQMDYLTDYGLITPEEEISKWEEFTNAQVEGTEVRFKAEKKLNDLRFQYSKNWIDREKYYKKLSLIEELAAWERVQAKYKEGHQYRLQAEREIFRVKQEIAQLDYQNAVDEIDDAKYYGKMNLNDELKAWKKIIAITAETSDERKKANREIFRLENEIRDANLEYEEKLRKIESDRNDKRIQLEEEYYNKTKEINDRLERDIKTLNDAYEDAVESRAKTLYSTWGLFDKVDPFQPIDGNELFKNLEDQVVAFDQWQAQIGNLTARGVDEGLIEELRAMGPKSLPQILALNKMTGTQLNGYVALWKKKSSEAKDQAVFELQDMKEETAIKIQELTEEAEEELRYYKRVWKDALRDLNKDTRRQLEELEADWVKNLGGMTGTGIDLIKQFRLEWFNEIYEIVSETHNQMAELKKLTSGSRALDSAAEAVTSSLRKMDTNSLGRDAVIGFSGGVLGTVGMAAKAGIGLMSTFLGASRKTLDSHSPSREMEKLGEFSVEGFVQGLRNLASSLYNEGASVGKTALEAVSLSLNSIPDLLDEDANAFTITPVLDLTNVKSGIYDINSLFGNTSGLDLSTSVGLLPTGNVTNQNGMLLAELRDALLNITNQEVDLSGTLTVQVVNDRGEIIELAEMAVKDVLRRESR